LRHPARSAIDATSAALSSLAPTMVG
jgi:hypothetical protein